MQVNNIEKGDFKPVRFEVILETPSEVHLFETMVENNVTVPRALRTADYITDEDLPKLASMMSKLNTFKRN